MVAKLLLSSYSTRPSVAPFEQETDPDSHCLLLKAFLFLFLFLSVNMLFYIGNRVEVLYGPTEPRPNVLADAFSSIFVLSRFSFLLL